MATRTHRFDRSLTPSTVVLLLAVSACGSRPAAAQNAVAFSGVATLTAAGPPVTAVSPTSVGAEFVAFDADFAVTSIGAIVAGEATPLEVTGAFADGSPLVAGNVVAGLPATVADLTIADASVGSSFDAGVALNGAGQAVVAFTDVRLGEVPSVFGPLEVEALVVEFSISVGAVGPLGDFNVDGVVDPADFDVWVEQFNAIGGPADANGDGPVDAADYTVWRDALEGAPAIAVATPEPGGGALAACLAVLATLGSRAVPGASRTRQPSPTTACKP